MIGNAQRRFDIISAGTGEDRMRCPANDADMRNEEQDKTTTQENKTGDAP